MFFPSNDQFIIKIIFITPQFMFENKCLMMTYNTYDEKL